MHVYDLECVFSGRRKDEGRRCGQTWGHWLISLASKSGWKIVRKDEKSLRNTSHFR